MTGATASASAPAGHWLAVASAEHVAIGRAQGFMQVCHGKRAPLKRIRSGDRVVYYSPCSRFGGKDKLQSFTAIGVVRPGEPYAFDMGEGFHPSRRDVEWWPAQPAPITPLLALLECTAGMRNWGYQLRFGLLPISARDMEHIASAMQARRS